MYCNCKKPAVQRTVAKSGVNFGKAFFSCESAGSGGCEFFHWVGAAMPRSVPGKWNSARPSKYNEAPKPAKSDGRPAVSLTIASIDTSSTPPKLWIGAVTSSQILPRVFNNFPKDMYRYCSSSKTWQFRYDIYDSVVNMLYSTEYSKSVELVDLPKFLSKGIHSYCKRLSKAVIVSENDATSLRLETSLLDTLLPFQLEGIRFVVKVGGRALIGDEMGCGKTIQAIGVLQHYRACWPALVLTPVNLTHQWTEELLRYSGDILTAKDIHIVRKATDAVQGKICIVPYTIVEKLVEKGALCAEQFGVVIADESHNLKSKDAKRTLVSIPLMKQIKIAVCLTGTPATNRPVELFSQLSGLLPEIFYDYDGFVRRYCDAKTNGMGHFDVNGCSNAMELKLLLEGTVMIRRLKSDVLNNLPTKEREIKYVDPDREYGEEIKDIQKKLKNIERSLKVSNVEPSVLNQLKQEQRTVMNNYYSMTGLSKVESIKLALSQLIEEARAQRAAAETADDESRLYKQLNPEIDEDDRELIYNEATVDDEPKSVGDSATTVLNNNNNNRNPSELIPAARSVLMVLEDDGIIEVRSPESIHTSNSNNRNNSDANRLASASSEPVAIIEMLPNAEEEGLVDSDEEENTARNKNNSTSRSQKLKKSKVSIRTAQISRPEIVDIVEDNDLEELGLYEKSDQNNVIDDYGCGIDESIDYFSCRPNSNSRTNSKTNKTGTTSASIVGKRSTRSSTKGKETFAREINGDVVVFDKEDKRSNRSNINAISSSNCNSDNCNDDEAVVTAWKGILGYDGMNTDKVSPPKRTKRGGKKAAAANSAVKKNGPVYRGLGKKIIVFAHHKDVLDALEDYLRGESVALVRMDGNVPANQRDVLVKRFQEDDETDVALLSVTACGTGVNLTRANVALFAELHWSPGAVLQAEDRIHRIGQTSTSVKIIYLIARGTADDIIWEQIQKKYNVLGATVGIADNKGAGMSITFRQNVRDDSKQMTLDGFMKSSVASTPSSQQQLQPQSCFGDITSGSDLSQSGQQSHPNNNTISKYYGNSTSIGPVATPVLLPSSAVYGQSLTLSSAAANANPTTVSSNTTLTTVNSSISTNTSNRSSFLTTGEATDCHPTNTAQSFQYSINADSQSSYSSTLPNNNNVNKVQNPTSSTSYSKDSAHINITSNSDNRNSYSNGAVATAVSNNINTSNYTTCTVSAANASVGRSLSPKSKLRIEENKRIAMEKLAQRKAASMLTSQSNLNIVENVALDRIAAQINSLGTHQTHSTANKTGSFVFSTGKGSSLTIAPETIDRASKLLEIPQQYYCPPSSVSAHQQQCQIQQQTQLQQHQLPPPQQQQQKLQQQPQPLIAESNSIQSNNTVLAEYIAVPEIVVARPSKRIKSID